MKPDVDDIKINENKRTPYYIKFVFLINDDIEGYTTSDIESLRDIDLEESGHLTRMIRIRIGDILSFNIENQRKRYKVTNIAIKNIFDDTEEIYLGIDSENIPDSGRFGKHKKYIMSIFVYMDFLEIQNT